MNEDFVKERSDESQYQGEVLCRNDCRRAHTGKAPTKCGLSESLVEDHAANQCQCRGCQYVRIFRLGEPRQVTSSDRDGDSCHGQRIIGCDPSGIFPDRPRETTDQLPLGCLPSLGCLLCTTSWDHINNISSSILLPHGCLMTRRRQAYCRRRP